MEYFSAWQFKGNAVAGLVSIMWKKGAKTFFYVKVILLGSDLFSNFEEHEDLMLQLENEPKVHKNLNSNINVSKPSDLRGQHVYPGSKYTHLYSPDLYFLIGFRFVVLVQFWHIRILWNTINYSFCPTSTSDMWKIACVDLIWGSVCMMLNWIVQCSG